MHSKVRIGQGYDVHAFDVGHYIVLGGEKIPHTNSIKAHSDGDVLLHAVCDALLGAMALGDIGMHFPDTDPQWRGADSRVFLRHIKQLLSSHHYRVLNIDTTVLSEAPRLGKYRDLMRANIAHDLGINIDQINIKATTSEGLGFIGKREGLACHAITLIESVG